MGIAHRTAGRLVLHGVTLGKANAALSMDTFPFIAVVTTHSLNSIVTADHECAGANIIGASRVTHAKLVARAAAGTGTNQLRRGVVGTLDQAGFPHYTTAPDGYPVTTDIDFRMLVGYACNADRYEDWITNPFPLQNASHGIATTPPLPGHPQNPLQRDVAGNMFITGQIQDQIAAHTASDIVLSAFGRGAGLFTGVMDNTDVFFKVVRVALGDNRNDCDSRGSLSPVRFRPPPPASSLGVVSTLPRIHTIAQS